MDLGLPNGDLLLAAQRIGSDPPTCGMVLPPPTSAAVGWRPTLMPTVAMIIRMYVRVQQYHASTRTPVTTNLSIARSALASHLRVHDGHARRPTSPRPSLAQRPRDLPPHRRLFVRRAASTTRGDRIVVRIVQIVEHIE